MPDTVTLISNENDSFEVPYEKVIASQMIKSVLDPEYGDALGEEEEETQIPLPMISTHILRKIVPFMNNYGTEVPSIPTPLKSKIFSDNVSEWDDNFLDVERDELMGLLQAADYLDMKGLLLLCSAKIAHNIRGMSTEEMREYLNIKNDFTPEEEAQVKRELAWCDDVFNLDNDGEWIRS